MVMFGVWYVVVDGLYEFEDCVDLFFVVFEGFESGDVYDGGVFGEVLVCE